MHGTTGLRGEATFPRQLRRRAARPVLLDGIERDRRVAVDRCTVGSLLARFGYGSLYGRAPR
jgi:hypothetical protein